MPRYFFNVHDGRSLLDQDGTELSGPDEARVMAIKLFGEIFRDEAESIRLDAAWRIAVLDEVGKTVFEVQVHLSASEFDGQRGAWPEHIGNGER
jgi:hypothetical protein